MTPTPEDVVDEVLLRAYHEFGRRPAGREIWAAGAPCPAFVPARAFGRDNQLRSRPTFRARDSRSNNFDADTADENGPLPADTILLAVFRTSG